MNLSTLVLCAAMAIPVTQGDVAKQFTVKKSFDAVANHIQNETDAIYSAMGVEVLSRKDGEVSAGADTPFGRIEWRHKEKIERSPNALVFTITTIGDKYKFYSKTTVSPAKRGTLVQLEARMSLDDERIGPGMIEAGINKIIGKIKKHLKSF